jgi:hypothetical protein
VSKQAAPSRVSRLSLVYHPVSVHSLLLEMCCGRGLIIAQVYLSPLITSNVESTSHNRRHASQNRSPKTRMRLAVGDTRSSHKGVPGLPSRIGAFAIARNHNIQCRVHLPQPPSRKSKQIPETIPLPPPSAAHFPGSLFLFMWSRRG